MAANSKLNYLLIFALPAFLSACAPDVKRLSDDPENEPIVQTPPPELHTDLPSTGDVLAPPLDGGASLPPTEKEKILREYDYVDPTHIVPTKALEQALIYYHDNKANIPNWKVLSIIDFSQSSTKKRWYFINMENGAVWNINVAHGKGSDANHDGFAESFSNVSGTNASSVGVYKTAETYQGSHGYSLKLDGLSTTNSNVRARAIVVHGADYVKDSSVIQGRSWGCPAVSLANYKKVIDLIKGGSIILAVN